MRLLVVEDDAAIREFLNRGSDGSRLSNGHRFQRRVSVSAGRGGNLRRFHYRPRVARYGRPRLIGRCRALGHTAPVLILIGTPLGG